MVIDGVKTVLCVQTTSIIKIKTIKYSKSVMCVENRHFRSLARCENSFLQMRLLFFDITEKKRRAAVQFTIFRNAKNNSHNDNCRKSNFKIF